jgi:peptidoglycan/LPS O-acetylase OafA/YrhL
MPPHSPPKDRLLFLDVARGVAALLVVFEHGLETCLPGYLEWSLPRVNLGVVGVLLFFLISGFIIPASLVEGGSQARFWLRRFFRLFPLYWLAIVGSWLYLWCGGGQLCEVTLGRPGAWLANFTMLQGFIGQPNVLGVFWTLQVELIIYAMCSILHALGLLERPALLTWLVLAFFVVEGGILRPLLAGKPFFIGGRMFYYLAPLVGAVFERYVSGRVRRGPLVRLLLGLILGVSIIWTVNTLALPADRRHHQVWRLLGNWLIAFGGFALLVAARQRYQPPQLAWIGRVSYSIYLLHILVLALLMPTHWPAWLFLPALAGMTLALSALTFKLVEQPGIALGRALERRWFGPVTPGRPAQIGRWFAAVGGRRLRRAVAFLFPAGGLAGLAPGFIQLDEAIQGSADTLQVAGRQLG